MLMRRVGIQDLPCTSENASRANHTQIVKRERPEARRRQKHLRHLQDLQRLLELPMPQSLLQNGASDC